ncbi:MAG: hypothetical protein WKF94_15195 [Solirubrobacteraceae bacterium]
MRPALCMLAAVLIASVGCGSSANGDGGAANGDGGTAGQRLAAAVRASRSVEDVRTSNRLMHSFAGTKLKLRSRVRQKPDGSLMHARIRVSESVGQFRRHQDVQMIVADGRIFARYGGRWRRVEDTSPHFSYDEALALIRRIANVESVGAGHYRGDLNVARHTALEPLRLLEEGRAHEATVDVLVDAQRRVRRFGLSFKSDKQQDDLEARVEVVSFDKGLQIESPEG